LDHVETEPIIVSTFAVHPPLFGITVSDNGIMLNKGMIPGVERASRVHSVGPETCNVHHDKVTIRAVRMSNDHPKMATRT
jgi:hypothetical protein